MTNESGYSCSKSHKVGRHFYTVGRATSTHAVIEHNMDKIMEKLVTLQWEIDRSGDQWWLFDQLRNWNAVPRPNPNNHYLHTTCPHQQEAPSLKLQARTAVLPDYKTMYDSLPYPPTSSRSPAVAGRLYPTSLWLVFPMCFLCNACMVGKGSHFTAGNMHV